MGGGGGGGGGGCYPRDFIYACIFSKWTLRKRQTTLFGCLAAKEFVGCIDPKSLNECFVERYCRNRDSNDKDALVRNAQLIS